MRATGPLLAFGALALFTVSAQAQGFEGAVTYQMHGEGEHPMTMNIKGDKIRIDMQEARMTGYMIMDMGGQTMTTVIPDRKMYMTMDMKQMRAMTMDKTKKVTPPKIRATGQSETIAGHTCQDYVFSSDDGDEVEVCGAKGMGNFMAPQGPMGGGHSPFASIELAHQSPEWAKLASDGFFPLKVTNLQNGKHEVVMEATKVEPQSLDASMFQVPPGFNEMKMGPGMMGPNH
jgi:Domain of unknown function (DUF4412)